VSEQRELKVGDEFASDNGTGTHRAVILAIHDDRVYLERWDTLSKTTFRMQFELPYSYLRSPSCAWRKLSPTKPEAP